MSITRICICYIALGEEKGVNTSQVILKVLIKMLNAKSNVILPCGIFIIEFLLWKEVRKKNNEVTRRIRNPINSQPLAQSSAHITLGPNGGEDEEEEEAELEANVQGEQHGSECFTGLEHQIQGLNANIDARFNAVDSLLNAFDGQMLVST